MEADAAEDVGVRPPPPVGPRSDGLDGHAALGATAQDQEPGIVPEPGRECVGVAGGAEGVGDLVDGDGEAWGLAQQRGDAVEGRFHG